MVSMLRDDFRPPLLKKSELFYTRKQYFQNKLKVVIQLHAPLHFVSKKKTGKLGFWFIICKTPSSGQNVLSLFFINFFKNLCLFSERDFKFEVEILLQCHYREYFAIYFNFAY